MTVDVPNARDLVTLRINVEAPVVSIRPKVVELMYCEAVATVAPMLAVLAGVTIVNAEAVVLTSDCPILKLVAGTTAAASKRRLINVDDPVTPLKNVESA